MIPHNRFATRLVFIITLFALILAISPLAGCGGDNKGDTGNGNGKTVNNLAWPTNYYNNLRTGRSPYAGPETPSIKWQYEAGTTSIAWCILGKDGKVISGFQGKLVCIDQKNGSQAWEFPTGESAAATCRVKDDGTIIVSAGNGVYCLTSKGTQKWSYDMGSEADEPAVGADGTVYVGCLSGKLAALSTDGKLEWETTVPGNIRSPSIDEDGNLYCSASPLVLYMFDKNGKQKWAFKPEGDLPLYEGLYSWANTFDVPSIGKDGTIYVGSFVSPGINSTGQFIQGYAVPDQGKLFAVTPQGEKKWEYFRPDGKYTIHSPTIGEDGTLYVGTSCWKVLALKPDGTLLWEFLTDTEQKNCPSVYSPSIGKDGLLYSATTSGKMFCITPQGTEKWRYDCGTPWMPDMSRSNNFTPPAIGGDGVIFSTLFQGRVYAFGP